MTSDVIPYPKHLNRAIDAEMEITNDKGFNDLMFVQSVLAQCILPIRKTNAKTYERKIGRASLRLTVGQSFEKNTGEYREGIGLPYGAKARLILLHICAEAVRTQSPEIEVAQTMTAFMRSLGLKVTGGKNGSIASFKEQLQRLATCRISLNFQLEDSEKVDGEILEAVDDRALFASYSLWTPSGTNKGFQGSTVRLSNDFYNQLMTHGVPLHGPAIRSLTDTARGLDIYAWLAYRLCRVSNSKGQLISWQAIQAQFGHGGSPKTFRRLFKTSLMRVQGVYPAAFDSVEIIDNGKRSGLLLKQAAPPVPFKMTSIKRIG